MKIKIINSSEVQMPEGLHELAWGIAQSSGTFPAASSDPICVKFCNMLKIQSAPAGTQFIMIADEIGELNFIAFIHHNQMQSDALIESGFITTNKLAYNASKKGYKVMAASINDAFVISIKLKSKTGEIVYDTLTYSDEHQIHVLHDRVAFN